MIDFYTRYNKKSHQNKTVARKNMRQKELHIRVDEELEKNLVDLARELSQDKSKVARDILIDHFLEQNHRDWKKDVGAWQ